MDGPGGAGKSTFAQVLAAAFAALGGRAAIVHLDDSYRPSVERPQRPLKSRPPAGDYDWERLRAQVLQPLAEDQPARLQLGLERDGEAARSRWEEDWMPAEEHNFHRRRP